ncbi:GerW family sporulation protein [Polycladomyces subterraneus]|uniref:GerW family sporulation protein n=1 Tax=Polycladomyces subterraneus TaxID=1016997 RepID=A0ABT8IMY1_9BACL|nr:GerW family sporulation protein [Polycladomyces subterraneus]MDN4594158.1 GerW family sporulation protein [Polycladomyces subterraneus]
MAEHPIQGLMSTAMENLKEMVDVNTIVGDPVETPDGSVIIPVSRVGFGFAAGGSEFDAAYADDGSQGDKKQQLEDGKGQSSGKLPFGGGSGGGVSITPVAFLVVGEKGVRLLNMDGNTHLIDRLIDFAPGLMERVQNTLRKKDKQGGCELPRTDI